MCKPTTLCRECGTALDASRKADAQFCATACRIAWRNRRSSRGAELYDCFMAIRFRRGPAKLLGMWSLMCRMASVWAEEDSRDGRQSFFEPKETVERLNKYRATVLVGSRR